MNEDYLFLSTQEKKKKKKPAHRNYIVHILSQSDNKKH